MNTSRLTSLRIIGLTVIYTGLNSECLRTPQGSWWIANLWQKAVLELLPCIDRRVRDSTWGAVEAIWLAMSAQSIAKSSNFHAGKQTKDD